MDGQLSNDFELDKFMKDDDVIVSDLVLFLRFDIKDFLLFFKSRSKKQIEMENSPSQMEVFAGIDSLSSTCLFRFN